MQIILESARLEANLVPPDEQHPMGAIMLVAIEDLGTGIRVPISVDLPTALGLAARIFEVAGVPIPDVTVAGAPIAQPAAPPVAELEPAAPAS